jgi:poly(A) polymerase/tRNA nucleotidyltransferase (CCA-adding enzyme)
MKRFKVPPEVLSVAKTLKDAGFEAFLVGGCTRDMLRGKTPKDWDFTTNAVPEEIEGLFENTYYNNTFGTVGVVLDEHEGKSTHVIEVTPFRVEANYSDSRRPDEVTFSKHIDDDLKRRDFTMNAIALDPVTEEIVDHFGGESDIKKKVIKAVGDAHERFDEDALRILRAIRLGAELGFMIESETAKAIDEQGANLMNISKERIRDEFSRILMSKRPMEALALSQKLGVLKYMLPDLERGIGVDQNQAHSFDVYEHNLRTLQHAADKGWPLELRLAAILHDISKPETRRWSEKKKDYTFHGHEVVGARVAKGILEELRFPKKTIEKVVTLVRWHMFFSDPDQITLSAVRRMIRNVGGEETMWDLMDLRVCDRIGTGRPKEQPFRLRKYKSMVEEALRDPTTVGMLKISGDRLMEISNEDPGPKIGFTLHALLEQVLENPTKNTKEHLESEGKRLMKLPIHELQKLGEAGKQKQEDVEKSAVKKLRKKYHVT